ncbi:MAG: ABC transporter permease [Promethearchaeota archaeon]|nr:MAG: ABC transporter permease [Candidatus Lokiarchaeota archaeon]
MITQQELKEKEEKDISFFKRIFHWMVTNFKFLLIPGYNVEDLQQREIEYKKRKSKRKFIRRLKSILTIIGILIILMIVTFAVFAPWISPYSYNDLLRGFFTNDYEPPSFEHILGTTFNGRDIFGRAIYGARTSLTIALPALLMAVSGGIVIGLVSGYYGGWVDSVLMRIMDVFLAFPSLILVLVLIAILGRQIQFFMLAYGLLGIAGYARLIRGSVLQAKELDYVKAAKVSGASNFRIIFKHILPNCIQPILISFTFDIGGVILSLAGLSFLGLGNPDQLIEWGNDVAATESALHYAPWAFFVPGIMIVITVFGCMLLGDGLRDALDPRLRNL